MEVRSPGDDEARRRVGVGHARAARGRWVNNRLPSLRCRENDFAARQHGWRRFPAREPPHKRGPGSVSPRAGAGIGVLREGEAGAGGVVAALESAAGQLAGHGGHLQKLPRAHGVQTGARAPPPPRQAAGRPPRAGRSAALRRPRRWAPVRWRSGRASPLRRRLRRNSRRPPWAGSPGHGAAARSSATASPASPSRSTPIVGKRHARPGVEQAAGGLVSHAGDLQTVLLLKALHGQLCLLAEGRRCIRPHNSPSA